MNKEYLLETLNLHGTINVSERDIEDCPDFKKPMPVVSLLSMALMMDGHHPEKEAQFDRFMLKEWCTAHGISYYHNAMERYYELTLERFEALRDEIVANFEKRIDFKNKAFYFATTVLGKVWKSELYFEHNLHRPDTPPQKMYDGLKKLFIEDVLKKNLSLNL